MRISPKYTIKDWELWEGQWELIYGIAWAMSPMPNSRHQEISLNILLQLKQGLGDCASCKAYMPVNYKISQDTMVHPDVLVVCNAPKSFLYLEKRPAMVVEILSRSTAQKDLNVKANLYADQGIPYYMLVHPEEEWVRVMALESEEWTVAFEGNEGTFVFDFEDCEVAMDFQAIWN